jgi:hypothetical protein
MNSLDLEERKKCIYDENRNILLGVVKELLKRKSYT